MVISAIPPMQGPFTEQHVGGMPHRHTKIILAGDLEAIINPGDFRSKAGGTKTA